MERTPRPRHYIAPAALTVLRPALRYSPGRGAYVLRIVGDSRGPVLRENRRRGQHGFDGSDRRAQRVSREHAVASR